MTYDLTTVIINYRTPDLTRQALTSFQSCYPTLPLLLIDNGSGDGSTDLFRSMATEHPGTFTVIENRRNLHHGPAMDQALRTVRTPFVLFLDSDCRVLRGGFVETMVTALGGHPQNYAIGNKVWMNRRGFDVPESAGAFEYIRPICMLIRRDTYLTLPPFERHGAPCLANMREAVAHGFRLLPFAVEEYVQHPGRGTAGRFGYRLGWRGLLNHVLNRLGP
jgi:GT2 family glycosyltransferase